jgi:hypothetical protein
MSRLRTIALVVTGMLVLTASLLTTNSDPVGAATPGKGFVQCQQATISGFHLFDEMTLSGCSDPANTGGSGSAGWYGIAPRAIPIVWASGGTTNIVINWGKFAPSSIPGCPAGTSSEFVLTGRVGKDTTGSIKRHRFAAVFCYQQNSPLQWSETNLPGSTFDL